MLSGEIYLRLKLYLVVKISSDIQRCDMAFIEPMHRNKPNITYSDIQGSHSSWKIIEIHICFKIMEKSVNFIKRTWNL